MLKKPHLAALPIDRDQLFIRQLQDLPSSLRLGHDVDFDRGAVGVVCWELNRGVSAAVDSDLEVLGDWRVILGCYIEVYLPGEAVRPNGKIERESHDVRILPVKRKQFRHRRENRGQSRKSKWFAPHQASSDITPVAGKENERVGSRSLREGRIAKGHRSFFDRVEKLDRAKPRWTSEAESDQPSLGIISAERAYDDAFLINSQRLGLRHWRVVFRHHDDRPGTESLHRKHSPVSERSSLTPTAAPAVSSSRGC